MLTALFVVAAMAAAPIPLDTAHRIFEDIRLASEEEAGRLWGTKLYGPTLLVDPASRFAVANQQDAGGLLVHQGNVFTGTLPPDVILANTGVDWSGTRWTMVLWTALGNRTVPRRQLLFHESWHRIQNSIGFAASESPISDLDSVDGRYWLRLEMRALAAALRASGDERKTAIADAAAFRARRRLLLTSVATAERALEANEGLAEFTGYALRGTTDMESRLACARALETLDPNSALSRSFAYQTGPAYGLLLNTLALNWTRSFTPSSDLAATLLAAAGVEPAKNSDERAASYGGAEMLAFENRRAAERRAVLERHRTLFLSGPVLELPMANARFGFDPDRVVTLDSAGSVHPKLDVVADWGKLTAESEVLITADFSRILVPARPAFEREGQTIRGAGWTVELNSGWTVSRDEQANVWRAGPIGGQTPQK